MAFDDFKFGFNDEAAIQQELREASEKLCMGRIKCSHCGKVYGVCSEVEYELQGENMIPTRGSVSASGTGKGQPSSGRQQAGLEYCRWNSTFLSFDKKTARILEVRINERKEGRTQYSDVILKLSIDGIPRLLGLKVDAGDELEKLTAMFGTDENKWIGKEFSIYKEEDSFDSKVWVRVAELEDGGKKKRTNN